MPKGPFGQSSKVTGPIARVISPTVVTWQDLNALHSPIGAAYRAELPNEI